MTLSLPKQSLLTKSWQYQHVYKNGYRLRIRGINLIFTANQLGQDRLGISISGIKLAIRRNRTKRLLKEFYRHNRSFPSQVAHSKDQSHGIDLVIATNISFTPTSEEEVVSALSRFLEMYPPPSIKTGLQG